MTTKVTFTGVPAGSATTFTLSASIDEGTGRLLAAYFRIRTGQVTYTEDVVEGKAFADYDEQGRLLGVELIAACPAEALDRLVEHEPPGVRAFLRNAMPQQWCGAEGGAGSGDPVDGQQAVRLPGS